MNLEYIFKLREICQTYEYANDKLPLTQNIIRHTHVYKSVVNDFTNEFSSLKVIEYSHRSKNSNYVYAYPITRVIIFNHKYLHNTISYSIKVLIFICTFIL